MMKAHTVFANIIFCHKNKYKAGAIVCLITDKIKCIPDETPR